MVPDVNCKLMTSSAFSSAEARSPLVDGSQLKIFRKSSPATPLSSSRPAKPSAPKVVLSTTMTERREGQAGSARWSGVEEDKVGKRVWSRGRRERDLMLGEMKRAVQVVRLSALSSSGPLEAGLMQARIIPS